MRPTEFNPLYASISRMGTLSGGRQTERGQASQAAFVLLYCKGCNEEDPLHNFVLFVLALARYRGYT